MILSESEEIPQGLFDPVSCKNSRCTAVRAIMPNGRVKCRVKNRIRVGLSMAGPPQIHWTRSVPMYGTAESRFVITVAPQNDI